MAKTAEKKSKFVDPYDDTLALFTEGLRNAGLVNDVNLLLLVDNKLKNNGKPFKVTKAGDVLKHRTGDDVIIFLNENVFEKLPDDIKALVVVEALAYVSFNSETSTVESLNQISKHIQVYLTNTLILVLTLFVNQSKRFTM